MSHALSLAKQGEFTARPNPCVGAVIVCEGRIVGEGFHAYYGGDHAEVMALKQAGELARGARMYVTLEPCSHQGKTPPCIAALIEAGIQEVVVACLDPNPLVHGSGVQALRAAGIRVQIGLLALNAQRLNVAFFQRMQSQRPRVILKSAMSLDGRTAMQNGESKWITGPRARAQVQRLRASSDAIITGRGTLEQDDPSLNVRDEKICALPFFKQPKRLVLDSHGKIKKTQFETVTKESHALNPEGQIALPELLSWLAESPCNQVMVEAGAVLSAAFLKAGLVDEWHVFIAPKIMGKTARPLCDFSLDTMAQAMNFQVSSLTLLGEDLYGVFVPQ